MQHDITAQISWPVCPEPAAHDTMSSLGAWRKQVCLRSDAATKSLVCFFSVRCRMHKIAEGREHALFFQRRLVIIVFGAHLPGCSWPNTLILNRRRSTKKTQYTKRTTHDAHEVHLSSTTVVSARRPFVASDPSRVLASSSCPFVRV